MKIYYYNQISHSLWFILKYLCYITSSYRCTESLGLYFNGFTSRQSSKFFLIIFYIIKNCLISLYIIPATLLNYLYRYDHLFQLTKQNKDVNIFVPTILHEQHLSLNLHHHGKMNTGHTISEMKSIFGKNICRETFNSWIKYSHSTR